MQGIDRPGEMAEVWDLKCRDGSMMGVPEASNMAKGRVIGPVVAIRGPEPMEQGVASTLGDMFEPAGDERRIRGGAIRPKGWNGMAKVLERRRGW